MPNYGHREMQVGLDPANSQIRKNVPVDVYLRGTTTRAALFSTPTGTTKVNPFNTNATTGNYDYYVAAGLYDEVIGGVTIPVQILPHPSDIGAVVPPAPAAVRAHAFGSPSDSLTSSTFRDTLARYPLLLPVTTTRWRLVIRNYKLRFNVAYANAISFTGAWVGAHSQSGGLGTGLFSGTPVQALTSFSTAADGSEYVSAWVTDPAAQIPANVAYLLSYGYTAPTGTEIARGYGGVFYQGVTGSSALGGSMSPGALTADPSSFFDIRIEYEAADSVTNLGFVVGDSISEALITDKIGTPYPWPAIVGRRSTARLINGAIASTSMDEWTTASDYKWSRWGLGGRSLAFAIIHMGSNDIVQATTLATMQTRLLSIMSILRGLGVNRIYLATVVPRASFTAGNETVRLNFNAWLRTLPDSAAGCFEFARAVQAVPASGQTDSAVMDAAWAGDGTHPLSAAHVKMADTVAV